MIHILDLFDLPRNNSYGGSKKSSTLFKHLLVIGLLYILFDDRSETVIFTTFVKSKLLHIQWWVESKISSTIFEIIAFLTGLKLFSFFFRTNHHFNCSVEFIA